MKKKNLNLFAFLRMAGGVAMLLVAATAVAAPYDTLPEKRFLDFNDYADTDVWVHEGPAMTGLATRRALLSGTNHYHITGWTIVSARAGSSAYMSQNFVPPKDPLTTPPASIGYIANNLAANLRNDPDLNAMIESPIFNSGVGTLYFDAINSSPERVVNVIVEVATQMRNRVTQELSPTLLPAEDATYEYYWETAKTITLDAADYSETLHESLSLNLYKPVKLRIRRFDFISGSAIDDAFAVIDNIRVSYPPATVRVSNMAASRGDGGYLVNCQIDNASSDFPALNRSAILHYFWSDLGEAPTNVWQSVAMVRTSAGDGSGNGELYKAELPEQLDGGNLELYVECAFEGDYYQSPDFTGLGHVYDGEDASPHISAITTHLLEGVDRYTLTVTGGSGTGLYQEDEVANIEATPEPGQAFVEWRGDIGYVADPLAATTTVTMPSNNIAVAAWYTNIYYTLTVEHGSGSGSYTNTTKVTINAPEVAGRVFEKWIGDVEYLTNPLSTNTVVTMPPQDITVTALYHDLYQLTVVGGDGSGSYTNDQKVVVTANDPPTGTRFLEWVGDGAAYLDNRESATAVLSMPSQSVTIEATYVEIYQLTVNGGSGSGSYTNGQVVAISADTVPGKRFTRWEVSVGEVADKHAAVTTYTMGPYVATLTAVFTDEFPLTVNSGSGSGSYTNWEVVVVSANPPQVGQGFAGWIGDTNYLADIYSASTTYDMPSRAVAITATYTNILYTLHVSGAPGSGSYAYNEVVPLVADVPTGRTFLRWAGDVGGVADVNSASTTLTMPAQSVTLVAMVSSHSTTLPEKRFLDFNDYAAEDENGPVWIHDSQSMPGLTTRRALLIGINHYHRTGWSVTLARAGTSAYLSQNYIPPIDPVTAPPASAGYLANNLAANLRNEANSNPMIESPVFTNGVGTLYFDAINLSLGRPVSIAIEMATQMLNLETYELIETLHDSESDNYKYHWEQAKVIVLDAISNTDITRESLNLSLRKPVKLRLRRIDFIAGVSEDDAFAIVDNIRVSYPPTDVEVTVRESVFEPAYPAVGESIRARCYVDNVDQRVPTDSRLVQMVYRWRYLDQSIGAWQTNMMAHVAGSGDGAGNGECYECELPPYSQVGDLEYYFVCDFTGYYYVASDLTGLGYQYQSENRSPVYQRSSEPGVEFFSRLREFKSEYGRVVAEVLDNSGSNVTETVEMVLDGDYRWVGGIPLAGRGLTNLVWRFKGVEQALPASEEISTNVTYWGSTSGIYNERMPYGGHCSVIEEGARLEVQVDEGNYAIVTLDVAHQQYTVTRGEYQDFNQWHAPQDYFTETSGQNPKSSFVLGFTGLEWEASEAVENFVPIVGTIPVTNVFVRDPFFVMDSYWRAGSAAYISERPLDVQHAPTGQQKTFRNLALQLKGGNSALGLGQVYDTSASQLGGLDGLGQVAFKARVASTDEKVPVAFNKQYFTHQNYLVRGKVATSANDMSPHNPWVSVVGYYQDSDNFYEYRITQVPDSLDDINSTSDKRLKHELFKWRNGVATQLMVNHSDNTKLTTTQTMELRLANANLATTKIVCRYYTTDVLTYVDSANPLQAGSFGVMAGECRGGIVDVEINSVNVEASATGIALKVLGTSTFETDLPAWDVPSSHYTTGDGGHGRGIYGKVPAMQLGIYLQDTVAESGVEPSDGGWQLHKTINLNSFNYVNVVERFDSWRSKFVKLQIVGGSGDVVVDNLLVDSWHGRRIGRGHIDIYDWQATESWITDTQGARGNVITFDHTQANPALAQGLRSGFLDTGKGQMEFDYRVIKAPVKLTVQYTHGSDQNTWYDVESFEFSAPTGWQYETAYLGLPETGYFRVINERSGIYTNGIVQLDNVTVWDEPEVTNTSWRAYNVKVTNTDKSRVPLDDSKVLALNNHPTQETNPAQTVFQPFLRSPELYTGLGALSFYARVYNPGEVATLYLYATTNGWSAPESEWFELTRFEGISNTFFERFEYEPYDGRDIDAIRFGIKNSGGDKRVMLENIVITEPTFPGFDIVNVNLLLQDVQNEYVLHPQPMMGEEIDVEAMIDNIQLQPSNIVMYVSYYVGTNHWGIGNWPLSETVTRRMMPVPGDESGTRYRTVPKGTVLTGVPEDHIGGIDAQDANEVVQYYVWASYQGGIWLDQRQKQFTNPEWYYPVDLNARYKDLGWSPYYVAYDVPLNAVWINEINAYDFVEDQNGFRVNGVWDNSYVELAVPAWYNLGDWQVEFMYGNVYTPKSTVYISPEHPEQQAVTNGYAFFVISHYYIPPGPRQMKVDQGADMNNLAALKPAGVRLKRPMGMIEHSIAFSWDPRYSASGEVWAANDPDGLYVYVGVEDEGGSLSRVGDFGEPDGPDTWVDGYLNQNWTPGMPNVGQILPDGDAMMPGISNIVIVSQMNNTFGTQNDRRVAYYSFKAKKGISTNIVYKVDDWYRLHSIKLDQVEQLPVSNELREFTLEFPDPQENALIDVNIRLRPDLTQYAGNAALLNWIMQYEDGELIPMFYNNRQLTLEEQFWLDADPTVTNEYKCCFIHFSMDENQNLYLGLHMSLNDEKMTKLNSYGYNTVLKLQAAKTLDNVYMQWRTILQFNLTPDSFDEDNNCYMVVPDPHQWIIGDYGRNRVFYRWAVDVADPRMGESPLEDNPWEEEDEPIAW